MALIIGALPAFAYSYSYNNPAYESYIVTSTHAKGIIYLYDKASSVTGKNLGAYKNNTVIKAINYNYNKEFAFVVCPDGKEVEPELKDVDGKGHFVACHLYD